MPLNIPFSLQKGRRCDLLSGDENMKETDKTRPPDLPQSGGEYKDFGECPGHFICPYLSNTANEPVKCPGKSNCLLSKNKTLIFVSRHKPTNGQIATVKQLGYNTIKSISVSFQNPNPVQDLENAGITDKTIALVAPNYIFLELLRQGYTIIEFVNYPSIRVKGKFLCKGAWVHTLSQSTFYSCPLSPEDQEAGNLNW